MFQEEANLEHARPQTKPPGFGYSLVLRPAEPLEFLNRFREIWRVVASWGRFRDESAGDWPSEEECLASLPKDFASLLKDTRGIDIPSWLDDVHDRDWVVWSLAALDSDVRIDLSAESMPISTWPIRLIAELLGGEVIYADLWQRPQ